MILADEGGPWDVALGFIRSRKHTFSIVLAIFCAWQVNRWLIRRRAHDDPLSGPGPVGIYIDTSDRFIVVKAGLRHLDDWVVLSEGRLYLSENRDVCISSNKDRVVSKDDAVSFWEHAKSAQRLELVRISYQRILEKISTKLGPVGLVGDVPLTPEQLGRLREAIDQPVSLYDALRLGLGISSLPGRLSSLALVQSQDRVLVASAVLIKETTLPLLVHDYPTVHHIVTQKPDLCPQFDDLMTPPIRHEGFSFLAKGAALAAGKEHMPMIFDTATRLSLPISVVLGGQVTHTLITNFPRPASETVTTVRDNQTIVQLDIYQGARPNPKDNLFIGSITLGELPMQNAGEPKIEVSMFVYWLDWNVGLSVQLMDSGTGRRMAKKFLLNPDVQDFEDRQQARKIIAEHDQAVRMLERAMVQHHLEDETLREQLKSDITNHLYEDESAAISLYRDACTEAEL